MTTQTPAGGAAAAPASGTAAAASGAAPSSGAAGAAAPAAGATPDASAAAAGAASSAASAAGEGGKPGAAAKPALSGCFLDGPGEGDAPPAGEVDAARLEGFTKAEGADARKQAWEKLNDAEKAKASEGMSEEDRKALGLETKPADGAITYTDFKVPEGMTVDKALMDKAAEKFKAQGLNQDQAQAMVDFYAGDVAELIRVEAQKPYDLWRDTQNQWIESVHADAELGGAKNQKARADAARAIDTLMSKEEAAEVRAALTFTGATNNPAIFRLLARAGAKISEGRFVGGDPPAPAPKAQHEIMYPTTVKAAE